MNISVYVSKEITALFENVARGHYGARDRALLSSAFPSSFCLDTWTSRLSRSLALEHKLLRLKREGATGKPL